MKKKRKTRKHNSSGKFFLFLLLIFLIAVIYYYHETLEVEPQITASFNQNDFIELSDGLELPVCGLKNHAADHELRKFKNYALCYRESYEQAEWSAYCISDFQLEKKVNRSNDFRADPQISTGSAELSDYRKSGYDRGHLTPAADMAFSELAMSETFYMSNMSPQTPELNRGVWKDLEAQVRVWVKEFGSAYVVSGPVLNKAAAEYKSIGENKVAVPENYYKVILVPLYEDFSDRQTMNDSKDVMAIGFIIPNNGCKENFLHYAVSVDEVEKITGLDFYALLPDSVENRIESSVDFEKWTK